MCFACTNLYCRNIDTEIKKSADIKNTNSTDKSGKIYAGHNWKRQKEKVFDIIEIIQKAKIEMGWTYCKNTRQLMEHKHTYIDIPEA